MSREDPQMKIRLPAELHEQLADAARLQNRSLNSEVVARLSASFATQRDSFSADELKGMLQGLQGDVAEIKSGMASRRQWTAAQIDRWLNAMEDASVDGIGQLKPGGPARKRAIPKKP